MKHLKNKIGAAYRLPLYTLLLLLIAGTFSACRKSSNNTIRYELVGGDPKIDFIEFIGNDSCVFVAPGPLLMRQHYSVDSAGCYTVHVIENLVGHLYRKDATTLLGDPPFFEGTWVKK